MHLPTEEDLDWMEGAVQRHTGGFDEWWKQNATRVSGRGWLRIIITVWEASRICEEPAGKDNNETA
jgi:hypothetical protein